MVFLSLKRLRYVFTWLLLFLALGCSGKKEQQPSSLYGIRVNDWGVNCYRSGVRDGIRHIQSMQYEPILHNRVLEGVLSRHLNEEGDVIAEFKLMSNEHSTNGLLKITIYSKEVFSNENDKYISISSQVWSANASEFIEESSVSPSEATARYWGCWLEDKQYPYSFDIHLTKTTSWGTLHLVPIVTTYTVWRDNNKTLLKIPAYQR